MAVRRSDAMSTRGRDEVFAGQYTGRACIKHTSCAEKTIGDCSDKLKWTDRRRSVEESGATASPFTRLGRAQ
jgi:hypothetical protein